MPSTTTASNTSAVVRLDPARRRGLRRPLRPASLPTPPRTPIPAPIEPIAFLALLTRVRQALVDAGQLSPARLHDVRAFKTAYAELGYLRRLAAAGRCGGTILTSMRQLVAGLAPMHPAWDLAGDAFAVRDRHHTAVRRRLANLEAMGLLKWNIGYDEDGQERRTEIELRDPPTPISEELAKAAKRLARWQHRYGPALNTGARSSIHNAAGHGRPFNPSEAQRRGCLHARRRATARRLRESSKSISAPPSGALQAENYVSPNCNESNSCEVSVRTGVTRVDAYANPIDSAALEPYQEPETAGNGEGNAGRASRPRLASENGPVSDPASAGSEPSAPPGIFDSALAKMQAQRAAERKPMLTATAADIPRPGLQLQTRAAVESTGICAERPPESDPSGTGSDPRDPLGIVARVMARQAQREPVIAAIAADATRRALEVRTWDATRRWSLTRLREAWVVARYGARTAAESGPAAAGTVTDEQHARLKRAAARYERYAAAAPDGYPPLALAAILHIAAQAHQQEIEPVGAPRTLRYAIGALDQLSKRMRAIATADKPERYEAAAARAQRRYQKTRATKLHFRNEWPRWILLPGHQEPTFGPDGTLQLDPDASTWAPQASTGAYLLAIRDAYLLAQRPLPVQADGRRLMAHRHQHPDTRPERQEARPLGDFQLRELAHRTSESIDSLAELSPSIQQAWLNKLRRQEADQARADHDAYRAAIAGRRTR